MHTQSIIDPSNPMVHFERDALVYMLLLAAVRTLLKQEVLRPFGGVANADGVQTIGVDTGTDEPDYPELLAYLEQVILKAEVLANGASAVASVADSFRLRWPLGGF